MGIKQTLSKGLKGFGKTRIQVSHGSIITYSALLLILFIAFTIRVLPIQWEIPSGTGTLGLNEFDPYFQFALTRHMDQNGLLSPYWPTAWVNTQQFYPSGLDMSQSLPSLPMTTSIFYDIVSAIGVNIDLMSFCSIMAPLLGMLAVFIMYFIGKDVGGKPAGLLSALILALMPTFIQRSSLGFFDTETIGVISLLLFIFLFLRAIEPNRSLRSMILYSLGSAGALAYFSGGWGAAYFLIDLAALFVVVLVFIKRYSQRLLLSYSITFGLGLFIAMAIPILSPKYILSGAVLPVAAVFTLLCIAEVLRAKIAARAKTILAVAFLAIVVSGFILVAAFGDITAIAEKFSAALDPFQRASQPLVESVAEHQGITWSSLYGELGIGALFFIVGIYFALKNPTNRNVFLVIFGLTTLYFAGSMVRLLILLAPAFALLVSVGALGILKPFFTLLQETGAQIATKSKRSLKKVGREYSAIAILIVFALLVTNFAFSPQTGGTPRVYTSADAPMAITASSLQIKANVPQWLNMMSYMRENLHSTDVVASWWDYGNWIGYIGNVTTLCDNTTVNATQIENVGYGMMANETYSAKMLANYNTSYVVVFTTLRLPLSSSNQLTGGVQFSGYGDEGKWAWMADISGNAKDRFLREGFMTADYQWSNKVDFGFNATSGAVDWNAMGKNSTIYKIMSNAEKQWADKYGFTPSESTSALEYFTPVYIAGLEVDATTAAQQYSTLVPLVCLYKINWDAYYNATAAK
jgi:dolichyl-diphosphooligosaccharide--protein glycosyltransferase